MVESNKQMSVDLEEMLSEKVLSWVADSIGAGASVIKTKSLHGGSSPWLVHIEHEGSTCEAVLRVLGRTFIIPQQITTGAAALRVAEEHGLATPRLIASDPEGQAAGVPATLETVVAGTSTIPNKVSAERLRVAGAAIARVHKIPLDPRPDLPLKKHSLQHPTLANKLPITRRWATLYRASSENEKPAVVEAMCELTGWSADRAREVMSHTRSTPLLQLADDRVRSISRPSGETVFLHADLWAGNMMWSGDSSVTLIDWKDAGVGDPGVDLGHLRMKMATQYGPAAPAHVLDGWERESGRQATNLAYWDAVAALHTPTVLDDWEPGFDDEGNQLSSAAITGRRDAFLREALDQLNRE
jgi:aminoglycoside phosphotransferase (APT) family kinase protein